MLICHRQYAVTWLKKRVYRQHCDVACKFHSPSSITSLIRLPKKRNRLHFAHGLNEIDFI
ncbi:hypothetical protein HMPREF0758_0990 [Serratia odorifera DSM 4582]|uniref:Uncharacterized protein n=1 Tax=Serratia odorifera DSM 4582 TaxID=667129 RepID=D4DYJ0_SEROD|nr:hypothetical protein HMPREF0758_0990 [Serratia odorifera DSM 4582]